MMLRTSPMSVPRFPPLPDAMPASRTPSPNGVAPRLPRRRDSSGLPPGVKRARRSATPPVGSRARAAGSPLFRNKPCHKELLRRAIAREAAATLCPLAKRRVHVCHRAVMTTHAPTEPEPPPASRPQRPVVIGIAGGIGSGKSAVAQRLADRGAHWIDADRLAHDALVRPAVRQAIRERFGDGVLDADGAVDRRALGAAVFGDPERLRALEQIVHPHVFAALRDRLEALRSPPGRPRAVAVLDAPLLFETGLDALCDRTIFVDTPLPLRRRRVAERGWSADELARREERQWPLERKRERATDRLRNDADLARLERAVDTLWREVIAPLRDTPPAGDG
ncbi:MAG: dephospho-CoA kinase [Planctomycetota bacterium]|nr:MAG: dephospho-CoA kinase [Planctomycetota bacterium]